MRFPNSWLQSTVRVLVVAIAGVALAACASTSDNSGGSGLAGLFGGGRSDGSSPASGPASSSTGGTATVAAAAGTSQPAGQTQGQVNGVDSSLLLDNGYCPPVELRAGTETFPVYVRGHEGDDNFIRFEGSISKTARECHTNGDTLTIKVGIAGRLTAGPKGAAGNYTLPVRVAVVKQHGGNVFFSQAYKAPVSVTAPDYAGDFSYVVDDVSFQITPDDHDLIIYVGYDEGKPKTPAAPTG